MVTIKIQAFGNVPSLATTGVLELPPASKPFGTAALNHSTRPGPEIEAQECQQSQPARTTPGHDISPSNSTIPQKYQLHLFIKAHQPWRMARLPPPRHPSLPRICHMSLTFRHFSPTVERSAELILHSSQLYQAFFS